MKKLTGGQIAVLALTTIPMIAVGAGGAIGTYANAAAVLHRKETALGVVAAGEGATLVAALVMIVVTMLGQSAPRVVRAALWLLPAAASVMGLAIAPTATEAVVFALTPLAMTASAEGISFLARRIVVHRTGVDVEAQRRDSAIARKMNWHQASADHHPSKWQRKRSRYAAWRLANKVGGNDAGIRDGLTAVQRERIVQGADKALAEMFGLPIASPTAIAPDASGQPDNEADTASGHAETDAVTASLTGPDTRPDSPDPLSEIAKAASGPSDLVRSLATHGVPKDALVSEAVRLRPDMVADSIRRTAKRLGEGPYL